MQVFDTADANQNGELDFSEFVNLYNHTLELRKQYGLGGLPDGHIQGRIDAFIASRRRKGALMVKSHSLNKKTKEGGTYDARRCRLERKDQLVALGSGVGRRARPEGSLLPYDVDSPESIATGVELVPRDAVRGASGQGGEH